MSGKQKDFIEFITPVGRAVHLYHDQPRLSTEENSNKPILDEHGVQKAEYSVTLWWPKSYMDTQLIPLRTLAAQARDLKWPAAAGDQWFRLQPFLRDGDNPEHNTKRKEYLFGGVYLNIKSGAKYRRDAAGKVIYEGAPQIIGPYNEDLFPADMWAGAWCRASGIIFGTEYSGKNFISVRLNNIQKAPTPPGQPDEKMTGGRPDARSQFDPLSTGPAPGATTAGGLPNIL